MNKYKISFIYYLRLQCVLNLQSSFIHYVKVNRIGGVMGSVLASSVVDCGCEPRSGQSKDYKLVIVTSPLSTQYKGETAKTGWLGIRIMCPSGATCLPADCCFSKLAL